MENTLQADMTKLYNKFEQHLKEGSKILDLGCGSGRDSLYFMKKGYEVVSVDYSEELVKRSSALLNKEVRMMDMRELDFDDEFHGIWACASILHISRDEIEKVIRNCEKALKDDAILYCSFKYGDKEEDRNGRFFNFYNETSFQNLINQFTSLKIIHMWQTADVRKGREDEYWLNVIIEKNRAE